MSISCKKRCIKADNNPPLHNNAPSLPLPLPHPPLPPHPPPRLLLGINYRGSSQCAVDYQLPSLTRNLISAFYNVLVYGSGGYNLGGGPVSPSTIYRSGQHLVCAQNSGWNPGSFCPFMKGNVPASGINGSLIVESLYELYENGCKWCGSVRLGKDNDLGLIGELTSDYVYEKQCQGLCPMSQAPNLTEGVTLGGDACCQEVWDSVCNTFYDNLVIQ